jgi:hypothetical protein
MKRVILTSLPLVAVAGLVWAGQDMGGGGQEGHDHDGHKHAQASKEHTFLKEMAGTWNAAMKFNMPGMDEQEAKGTETTQMIGDFWAVYDIKFDSMMGHPWHGHGTMGYDPDKKKYVATFVHSATPYMTIGEGTMDAAGKVLNMVYEGMGPDGKKGKMRETFEKKDKDNAVMTMYGPGPDGKEVQHFQITYTRKK